MNELFEKNGFFVIKNFITKKRAKKLSKEFIQFCSNNPNECCSDNQIPGTPAKYDYDSFLELLCEKTPEVSKKIGETVLPTYSYARVYKNKDILKKHTDRDSCEISLTVHLDSDSEWEIFMETPEKEKKAIILQSGDALVYYGCTIPHWRDEYNGKYYSQVFLHYVKSKGSRKKYFFDKKTNNNIKNYIHVFEDVIPHELCDKIIGEYEENEFNNAQTVGGLDSKIRNCKHISLSLQDSLEKNEHVRKQIDLNLYEKISNVLISLKQIYGENLSVTEDTGYDLLKYEKDGFYIQHTDNHTKYPRTLSCSLCLNDDYEGGEFAFFDREIKYKLKKGSAIVFPSNFMYPHEIMPIINGTRYSIITWFK